jgi:lactose/L-arabinose transport system substrate-binding protein
MGANVPVIEQSDYHYNARTYIQAAITNVINGSDLDTELQGAEDQVKFEMQ